MTVAEDCGGYSNSVAENSFRRITTTVNLRLYFFDYDAFAAFNRFHITQYLHLSTLQFDVLPSSTQPRIYISIKSNG